MNVAQDWKNRKLTDLAEFVNGYAFKPEDWGEHGLPIIRIEQLKNLTRLQITILVASQSTTSLTTAI